MIAWDVKPDNNVLCALEMTQRCSATALSVSHFLPCLVRKEVFYMKTVRNNNTAQTLWENLCTRSVVPIFFFSCHFLVYNLVNYWLHYTAVFCFLSLSLSYVKMFVPCFVYSVPLYVFCVVSPFVFSCLFPIFVHIYRPFPPGGNPTAVNKYISYLTLLSTLFSKLLNLYSLKCGRQNFMSIHNTM